MEIWVVNILILNIFFQLVLNANKETVSGWDRMKNI